MFKIIIIPYSNDSETFDDELLTNYCLNKHINSYKAEFFMSAKKPCWTVFLEYDPVLEKKEYPKKEELTDIEKKLFEEFRKWRKEKADSEGLPVYIIATNKELHKIIKTVPKSLEALQTVNGFGRKKIEKYGSEIISIIKSFYEEP